MNIRNLQFFDSDGYNLNFEWDERNNYWEGNIYFPKVSVGLYANTSIYIMEKDGDDFLFPMGENEKVTFSWDRLNKFVDEFFMFNFDESYIIKETSALTYTPNDGPDCEPLIVNRFDTYEVDLETEKVHNPLPVHIAFSADSKYDGTTYNRTLIMSYKGIDIARIKFFAETVEEDERLKIWNSNLGYNITPEDTIIFYKSDIKEYKPDYILLNEKRKELMLEGSNIYPYIGSYRAIINAIKFFGYSNLGIIEFWRNVNQLDENFGKIYHSSRYSLTKKETLRVGTRTIFLPNKDYKKTNKIALVYSINQITGKVDEWELPIVKEKFEYTIEEAIIKLFALRNKLNKEFMPGSSRIIDVIGEANYFGLQGLTKTNSTSASLLSDDNTKLDFVTDCGDHIHITDDRLFEKYIVYKKELEGTHYETTPDNVLTEQFNVINDIKSKTISELSGESITLSNTESLTNLELCQLYTDYYNDVYIDHTRYEDVDFNEDDFTQDIKNDDESKAHAKIVLKNTSFNDMTFDECSISFGQNFSKLILIDDYKYKFDENSDDNNLTFDNLDPYNFKDIKWTIEMSDNQFDEDYKLIGEIKYFEKKDWKLEISGSIKDYNQIYLELPYVGYYDVTLEIGDYKRVKKKFIKVEPYNLEIKGFYYDTRELPERLKYDFENYPEMKEFIQNKLDNMIAWAVAERTSNKVEIDDFAMTTYTSDGKILNKSPYYTRKLEEEWHLADNISYLSSLLIPNINYSRYIRNGVDVKPFTWFILGSEYSKVIGKINPKWKITNTVTGESQEYSGKYLTCLLRYEGKYTITLSLKDINGNEYELNRNIFVVDKTSNYKLYQTFKKEYDYFMEEKQLAEARDLQSFDFSNFLS